jgi:hypothetical protein
MNLDGANVLRLAMTRTVRLPDLLGSRWIEQVAATEAIANSTHGWETSL